MTFRTLIKMLPEVYEFYVALIVTSAERFVARREAAELWRKREEAQYRYYEHGQPVYERDDIENSVHG